MSSYLPCYFLCEQKHKKSHKTQQVNFSAIHLIHDPQGLFHFHFVITLCKIIDLLCSWGYLMVLMCHSGLTEKLFQNLESSNERFEVKLMLMCLISRLVGIHQVHSNVHSLNSLFIALRDISFSEWYLAVIVFLVVFYGIRLLIMCIYWWHNVQLILLNFYPFLERFLQPHQRGNEKHICS